MGYWWPSLLVRTADREKLTRLWRVISTVSRSSNHSASHRSLNIVLSFWRGMGNVGAQTPHGRKDLRADRNSVPHNVLMMIRKYVGETLRPLYKCPKEHHGTLHNQSLYLRNLSRYCIVIHALEPPRISRSRFYAVSYEPIRKNNDGSDGYKK